MTMHLTRAALACTVLAMTGIAASASSYSGFDGEVGYSLAHVDVGLQDGDKTGARGTTDDKGAIVFSDLAPGRYVLVIDGTSLAAAMDKVAPPPEKKSGGSFSIGIGGSLFGGGSRGSRGGQGAGPAQGGARGGSSSGGAGIAGGYADGHLINQESYPTGAGQGAQHQPQAIGVQVISGDAEGGFQVSTVTPYCPGGAEQGIRIGFTMLEGGGAVNVKLRNIFNSTNQTGEY